METLSPVLGAPLDETFSTYLKNELLSSEGPEDEGDRDNEDC